jgi:hypothetical protein
MKRSQRSKCYQKCSHVIAARREAPPRVVMGREESAAQAKEAARAKEAAAAAKKAASRCASGNRLSPYHPG